VVFGHLFEGGTNGLVDRYTATNNKGNGACVFKGSGCFLGKRLGGGVLEGGGEGRDEVGGEAVFLCGFIEGLADGGFEA